MTDEIRAIELCRIQIPLKQPYHLSYVTVDAFDTTFIRIETDDGAVGLGEVTTLEGYSIENGDDAWDALSTFADRAIGLPAANAKSLADEIDTKWSFTRSAASCALFGLDDPPFDTLSVPVVGILSTDGDPEEAKQSLMEQLAAGYETIKVKIGFDPERDAARLQSYVDAAPDTIAFRVDANQGYELNDAQRFLDAAPIDRLQVVEQPLPVGRLDDHATLQAEYDATIMLDEEIRTAANLDAAVTAEAAGAVKFKLMKIGSVEETIELINRARQLGLDVVLGNGVQAEIGCLFEAMIWQQTGLELAGEFNGWLKQETTLVDGVEFEDGHLQWTGKSNIALLDSVDDLPVDYRVWNLDTN